MIDPLLIRWGISDETHVKRAASFQIVSGHCSSVELFSYFLAVMGSSSSKKNTGKVVTLSLISLYRFGSSNGLLLNLLIHGRSILQKADMAEMASER